MNHLHRNMGAISTYPLSLSLLLPPNYNFSSQTHFSNPLFSSPITLKYAIKPFSRNKILFSKSNYDDPNEKSMFLDEEGVVDDMDGYLNQLSLEYDSVWDTKPSWCQPWTIALTGVSVITGSWLVLHSVVITAIVLSLICAWWYIFLYSYPKAYSNMIAERRKMVKTGAEDTFGLSKGQ